VSVLPARGEIWMANLNPTLGHEQAGSRPVLIVSNTRFSQGPADLVIVCPLTSRFRNIPSYIPIAPPEGGVRNPCYVICEQVRAISHQRLSSQRWGIVTPATMTQVENVLRALLEL
jgi:mRNA interferase MazF